MAKPETDGPARAPRSAKVEDAPYSLWDHPEAIAEFFKEILLRDYGHEIANFNERKQKEINAKAANTN